MDHFKIDQKIVESVRVSLKEKGWEVSLEEADIVVNLIGEEVLYQYVDRLISQIETILEINPLLPEKEILQSVAKNIVEFLGAEAVRIRIYDTEKEELISF
jgi:hypothetical protein